MNISTAFDNANARYNAAHPVNVVNAGVAYKGKEYSTEIITAMREWIADCQWEDMNEEDITDLTPFQVLRGIEQHIDGGLDEFMNNML